MSLLYAGEQYAIYLGFFILTMGMIGNVLNVFVFLTVRSYRTTPCTFYFIIGLIHDIGQLLMNLTIFILSAGYNFDLTRTSTGWCKARLYCVCSFAMVSQTCTCLAVIDQFLVTSRSVRLRRWSRIEWAHRIIVVLVIFAWLINIPWLHYRDISPTSGQCIATNSVMNDIGPVYTLVLFCAIPAAVLVTFGSLTYRNIRLTTALNQQQADRQLTRMICMQVIAVIVSQVPYGTYNAYFLITLRVSKNADRLAQEFFASKVTALFNYGNYGAHFYVFLASSSRFRQKVKEKIFCCRLANRVEPMPAVMQ